MRVMSFQSDLEMLNKLIEAIDVYHAEATVASDRSMIFDKIEYKGSYRGGKGSLHVPRPTMRSVWRRRRDGLCSRAGREVLLRGGFLAVMEGQTDTRNKRVS